MRKKNLMRDFINRINEDKLMTRFIVNIFDYKNFSEKNYLFRMLDNEKEIIIDIYDNVSNNRFNRYIFSFKKSDDIYDVIEEENVFVNYINVLNISDSDNKLLKFAYLFKMDEDKMIDYAYSFLNDIFVDILKDIKNKSI